MQESKKLQRASNFRVDVVVSSESSSIASRLSKMDKKLGINLWGGKKNEKFDDHSSSVRRVTAGSLGFFGKKLWGKKKTPKTF